MKHALMTAVALHQPGALDSLIDHLIETGDPHGEALLRATTHGRIRLFRPNPAHPQDLNPAGPFVSRGDDEEYGSIPAPGLHLDYQSRAHREPNTWQDFTDHRDLAEALPTFFAHAHRPDALHGLASYLEHTGHEAAEPFRKALESGGVKFHPNVGTSGTEFHGAGHGWFGNIRDSISYRVPREALKLARQPFTQSLAVALASLRSKNTVEKVKALKALLSHAEENGAVHATIHHSPETGFVPAATISLSGPVDGATREIARYLAAWSGLVQQHPRVVAFLPDASGPDALHTITLPTENAATLADSLLSSGVSRFVLTRKGAVVFDRGARKNLSPIARNLNGSVNIVRGAGHLVGAGEGAATPADARAAHRDTIRAAENAYGATPPEGDPAPPLR